MEYPEVVRPPRKRVAAPVYRLLEAHDDFADDRVPGEEREAEDGPDEERIRRQVAPDPVPEAAKLYYSGLLGWQTRPAEGLGAILQDFFGVQTEVRTFVGRWMELPAENACRLGSATSAGLGAMPRPCSPSH